MTVKQFWTSISFIGLFMIIAGLYLWLGAALGTLWSGIILMALGIGCVLTADEETKP